jgi:4-amino-4-deoxy-L-arabinose transferase-like glycosyltransferase
MSRASRLFLLPLLVIESCFFLFVSQQRFVDGDEGFYLLASRLVLHHKVPYIDFFYTQAPLLPYVYAIWLKAFGVSWVSARVFCAVLTAALGILLYDHVCRATGEWVAGTAAVVLFATSSLVFAWYPIVKTFALTVLFLFAAYVMIVRSSPTSSNWRIVLAGLLTGLSIDTRSYIVVVIPVFIGWLVWERTEKWVPRIAAFCGGTLLGLAPSIVLFFRSPENFLFNNLGYHAIRSGGGLVGEWQNKMMVVFGIFGGAHTGFQFSIVALTGVVLVLFFRKGGNSAFLALWIAFVTGIVSLLPTPASVQYFSIVMPFLIVAAVCAASDYLSGLSGLRARSARLLGDILMVAFVGFGIPSFRQYLFTGYKVPGLQGPTDAPNWTLQGISDVSKAIDRFVVPNEGVASFWPGYIFASKADPYPGFENDFGVDVASQLSAKKRHQYGILDYSEIATELALHGPGLAVVGNQVPRNGRSAAEACEILLRSEGYIPIAKIGNTVLYSYEGRISHQ